MLEKKPVPRSFTEIREGDELLRKDGFHKVVLVLKSNRRKTVVRLDNFDNGVVVELDGLVFTKA